MHPRGVLRAEHKQLQQGACRSQARPQSHVGVCKTWQQELLSPGRGPVSWWEAGSYSRVREGIRFRLALPTTVSLQAPPCETLPSP